jgi:hypothetical protein
MTCNNDDRTDGSSGLTHCIRSGENHRRTREQASGEGIRTVLKDGLAIRPFLGFSRKTVSVDSHLRRILLKRNELKMIHSHTFSSDSKYLNKKFMILRNLFRFFNMPQLVQWIFVCILETDNSSVRRRNKRLMDFSLEKNQGRRISELCQISNKVQKLLMNFFGDWSYLRIDQFETDSRHASLLAELDCARTFASGA